MIVYESTPSRKTKTELTSMLVFYGQFMENFHNSKDDIKAPLTLSGPIKVK